MKTKNIDEIRLRVMDKKGNLYACRVGQLVFYPGHGAKSVFVRGGDIFSQFSGLAFAFKFTISTLRLTLLPCFIEVDGKWKPFPTQHKDLIENIIALMKRAIDSKNPFPDLEKNFVAPGNTEEKETIWQAMLRIYRCESTSVKLLSDRYSLERRENEDQSSPGNESSVLSILSNQKLSKDAKTRSLLKFFDGYCPGINWIRLEQIFKKYPPSQEVVDQAKLIKKVCYVQEEVLFTQGEPNNLNQLLFDTEILKYSRTEEAIEEVQKALESAKLLSDKASSDEEGD